MPVFNYGETVIHIGRTLTGAKDADGNDVYTNTETTYVNVPVWPTGSTEAVQGQDVVTTGITTLIPAGASVAATDQVRVYGGLYDVVGDPGRFASPFTATTAGVEVHLKAVTG